MSFVDDMENTRASLHSKNECYDDIPASEVLFVGSVPEETVEDDLVEAFSNFEVADVTIKNKGGKTFAFVTFASVEMAAEVLASVKTVNVKGRVANVKKGTPRKKDESRQSDNFRSEDNSYHARGQNSRGGGHHRTGNGDRNWSHGDNHGQKNGFGDNRNQQTEFGDNDSQHTRFSDNHNKQTGFGDNHGKQNGFGDNHGKQNGFGDNRNQHTGFGSQQTGFSANHNKQNGFGDNSNNYLPEHNNDTTAEANLDSGSNNTFGETIKHEYEFCKDPAAIVLGKLPTNISAEDVYNHFTEEHDIREIKLDRKDLDRTRALVYFADERNAVSAFAYVMHKRFIQWQGQQFSLFFKKPTSHVVLVANAPDKDQINEVEFYKLFVPFMYLNGFRGKCPEDVEIMRSFYVINLSSKRWAEECAHQLDGFLFQQHQLAVHVMSDEMNDIQHLAKFWKYPYHNNA